MMGHIRANTDLTQQKNLNWSQVADLQLRLLVFMPGDDVRLFYPYLSMLIT